MEMTADYGKKLAAAGLELRAIRLDTGKPFLWASGFYMPIYNDNRMLLIKGEYRRMIAEAFAEILTEQAIEWEYIAGTSTAGIPHATTLADLLDAPLTYVRDKPKGHGLKNRIEGLPAESGYGGGRVVLVEDLISTGGSSVRAVEGIREAAGNISRCLSIFNYGLDRAVEKFGALDPPCRIHSILTYDLLLETALAGGYIDRGQAEELREWRGDPFGWGEERGFSPECKRL
jgi:orotate phosphoribosyltransferase